MAFTFNKSSEVFTGVTYHYGSPGIVTEGAIDWQAPTGEDLVVKLGDNAAGNKLSVVDSDGAEVFAINSDGVLSGTLSSAAATLADSAGGTLYICRNDLTVSSSDTIGSIIWEAKDTDVSGGTYQPVAQIVATAAEDFDDSNDSGTNLNFWNCEIGSETLSLNMQLNASGVLKIDHIAECNGAHGIEMQDPVTFTLAASDQVLIDGATTASTTDSLQINHDTATDNADAVNIDINVTKTTGINNYGINLYSEWNQAVTDVALTQYGTLIQTHKSGADTSDHIATVAGLWVQSSNTGSTDIGTKNTYGGYFQAVGDTAGISTAYGIYATAISADTNYAGYFDGNTKLSAGSVLSVDHIAESSPGHGITFDSAVAVSSTTASSATGGVFTMQRDDTSVVTNDVIGTIDFQAKDTDAQGGAYDSVASIKCMATEDFDDADDAGTKLSFSVNPIGSETPQEEMALVGEQLQIDHISQLTGAHGLTIDSGWTASGQTCVDLGTVTTCNIDGGTIDNTAIGGATPAAGDFTTLTASGGTPYIAIKNTDGSIVNGQVIGTYDFYAADTEPQGGVYESVASIQCVATEDFDDADDAGTKLSFLVNPVGSETPQEEMALVGEVLKIDHIGELAGAHGVTFDNAVSITSGAISGCNVTCGAGTTLDVSAGTLTLAADQINGDKVEGGTINATTITTLGSTAINLTGELDMTGAVTIDMNPSLATTGNMIDITPTATVTTADQELHGIHMDGGNLDPSAAGCLLHAIHIDNSGVLMTNLPEIVGIHIMSPTVTGTSHSYIKALRLDQGKILHNYTSGSTAAADYDIYDIQIDASSQAATSETRGISIDCVKIPVGEVIGLSTHAYIKPIVQHLRTFTTPDQAGADSYAGRYAGAAYTAGIDTNEIFVANGDEIWIGDAAKFNDLQVIMTTAATKNVLPTFWYYNTVAAWVQFFPSDSTVGFTGNGDITWSSSGFTNWDPAGDPAGASGSAGYWIKIKRTRAADPGTPTPTTIKLATTTASSNYSWDADGDLSVRDITSAGGIALNRTAVTADVAAGAAVTRYCYMGWDGAAADTITISSEDIAISGRLFIIKDEGGTAAANPLTIATEGAETIDGNNTVQLTTNYGYIWLISNGTNLFILNSE